MENWISLRESDRKDIFEQTVAKLGIPSFAVEKDWWVTHVLQTLFETSFSGHLLFKGGTSLSKGWDLIDRFSEDIDLALDRARVDKNFQNVGSRSQVARLRRRALELLRDEFVPEMAGLMTDHFSWADAEIMMQEPPSPDTDPVIFEISFRSLTDPQPYLKPHVVIEISARSLMEPFEQRTIRSLVGEAYPEHPFGDKGFDIPIALPKRTFLEKAFLLHEEFQKPTERQNMHRLTRHFYDLEKLMDTVHGDGALTDGELYKAIVDHRSLFNPISGITYETHRPVSISFLPPDPQFEAIRADYSAMCENMIHGVVLSFERLMERMTELTERFRRIPE